MPVELVAEVGAKSSSRRSRASGVSNLCLRHENSNHFSNFWRRYAAVCTSTARTMSRIRSERWVLYCLSTSRAPARFKMEVNRKSKGKSLLVGAPRNSSNKIPDTDGQIKDS